MPKTSHPPNQVKLSQTYVRAKQKTLLFMACNLLIEHMKNIVSACPFWSWLKNSKYPEAFLFFPLIGAQTQKPEMLTYKLSKTTSFISSPIMVNYEFSNHNRSICFHIHALCLCSSLDICSLQVLFTYKWFSFSWMHTIVHWTTKSLQEGYMWFYRKNCNHFCL